MACIQIGEIYWDLLVFPGSPDYTGPIHGQNGSHSPKRNFDTNLAGDFLFFYMPETWHGMLLVPSGNLT